MANTKKTKNASISKTLQSKKTKKNNSKNKQSKKATSKNATSSIKTSFGFIFGILFICVLILSYLYFFQPTTFNSLKETTLSTISTFIDSNDYISEKTVQENQENTANDSSNSAESHSTANENQEKTAPNRLSDNDSLPTADENTALFWGNPSNATTLLSNNTNYLLEKKQYSISYNTETLNPNWVLWHLDADDLGDADRSDNFRPDNELPVEWYKVSKNDYQFNEYGFDRGHVCPSADRTSTQEDNSATFLMTNMIPQSPDCNRILWKDLESFERNLVQQGKELYIAAGPYGVGGTSDKGYFESIQIPATKKFPEQSMTVPSYCWKIILIMDEGDNDFDRIFDTAEILAVFMPNAQDIQDKGSWDSYLTTVDFIEDKTGYDFLSFIPDEIENNIEKQIYQTSVEFID